MKGPPPRVKIDWERFFWVELARQREIYTGLAAHLREFGAKVKSRETRRVVGLFAEFVEQEDVRVAKLAVAIVEKMGEKEVER